MKKNIKSKILSFFLFFCVGFISLAPKNAEATAFAAATEPSQIAHSSVNNAGWLWDAQAWLQERSTQLDKWLELIENNVLTRSIRGFNELMTAIQGDISDVLGTVDTLISTPTNFLDSLTQTFGGVTDTVSSIFQSVLAFPTSISGMFEGTGFSGLFDKITSTFQSVANIQANIGSSGNLNDYFGEDKQFGSPADLSNKVGAARSKLGADFLAGSKARADQYKEWERKTNQATYGNDAVQIASTQADIMTEIVKNQNRDQEFATMDRLQQNADRIMLYEREKSRANRMLGDAHYGLVNQIW
jgi:hypothetical protein